MLRQAAAGHPRQNRMRSLFQDKGFSGGIPGSTPGGSSRRAFINVFVTNNNVEFGCIETDIGKERNN